MTTAISVVTAAVGETAEVPTERGGARSTVAIDRTLPVVIEDRRAVPAAHVDPGHGVRAKETGGLPGASIR